MKLNEQVVVIIGIGGVGEGIAKALAPEGSTLILMDYSEKALEKVSNEIEGNYQTMQVDALNWKDMHDKMDAVAQRYGRIDACICTVGGTTLHILVDQYPEGKMEEIINFNFIPVYYAFHSAIPYMKKQHYGRLLCMDSTHGGGLGDGSYGVGKAGMMSMVQTIAVELAEYGITCNGILPGIVMSDLVRANCALLPEGEKTMLQAAYPHVLFGFNAAENIAECVKFFLSDVASHISGESIQFK